ncbi:MAG TPA: AarF/ABC1/UbiB kinase family protein [Polyangiaceae bacterium]|nr:AarF/ABC1/UbiB kinase family protein [Polyangiaceae bacterium]
MKRAGPSRTGSLIGSEILAWAEVVDSVLTAVEETAWSARRVAESARVRLRDGEEELRAAGDDLRSLPEQATRLVQTGWTLASIAAGYRLHRVRSAFVPECRADELLAELHEKSARRFHDVSAVHGGAFLKVGQLLSARPDLLPAAWIEALERLQDAAPAVAFSVVRSVIEADLGRPLSELFASFDEAPIAAASIGQVHRATTLDGRLVAVKVKRPGIAGRVKTDLQMLEAFVASLSSSLPEADYETIVREIRRNVLAELDYVEEASRTRRASAFFADHPDIVVPRPVDELCSERVLTTTFISGRKITAVLDELAALADAGDARAEARISAILGTLLEAYLRQVLEGGLFQADPHPGNLLVTSEDEIVVLDFGCAEVLSEAQRTRYLELVAAFVLGDRERLARLFSEIGFSTRSGAPETLLHFADALLGELRDAIRDSAIRWPTREEAVARMRALLRACEEDPVVELPSEFIMIARVFGTLGGQFAKYEPNIDVARHVIPVLGLALVAQVFS